MSEQHDRSKWVPTDGEAVYVWTFPGYGQMIFGKIEGEAISGGPADDESLWYIEYDEPHACSCGCGMMWRGDAYLKRMIFTVSSLEKGVV